MRPRLVIMLKEPHPGRVKTRLGRDIGMVGAAWWYRHHLASLLRQLDDPRWQIVLAVAPDRQGLQSRIWPAHLPRIAQGRGDLGARMKRQLAASNAPVLIIGSDIAGLDRAVIARCFALLARHDMVLGPAPDGGYWAIGAHRLGRPLPRRLFEGVRWSTPHTLADTLVSLGDAQHALAPMREDIDTLADLRRIQSKGKRPH